MIDAHFLFLTGIENSIPTIDHGRIRRDQMAECGHYTHWRRDFELTRELGIRYLRYGVPLYTAFRGPGQYDWSFADATFPELRRLGIVPVVDLCHFGVPDFIGNFQNPDFPMLLAQYAQAFAERYPWLQLYTPVNEIYTCARYSALEGQWNEQLSSDRAFVTALKHMAKASVLAMQAILRVRPDALFVQSESSEYFHAREPDAIERARHLNDRRFLSLDLTFGNRVDSLMYDYLLDNGMTRAEYDFFMHTKVGQHCVTGTDYYRANEHHVGPDGAIDPGNPDQSSAIYGYAMIAREYYTRYQLPMMYTETNTDQGPEGDEAVQWLYKQWAQVLGLRRDSIPVVGFTWYSLTDQVDWDIQLRAQRGKVNPRGLVDLDRNIRPAGKAYQNLIAKWRASMPLHSSSLRLPIADAPEGAAAGDEGELRRPKAN
jgi:beta-glucosidase/6-phospho-beta-glucosidase/beta-galactosidase